jgi:hypothetical protein
LDEIRVEDDAATRSPRSKRKRDLSPEESRELRHRQRAIGHALQRMFDDVAREPVPKEMLDLLRRLDDEPKG